MYLFQESLVMECPICYCCKTLDAIPQASHLIWHLTGIPNPKESSPLSAALHNRWRQIKDDILIQCHCDPHFTALLWIIHIMKNIIHNTYIAWGELIYHSSYLICIIVHFTGSEWCDCTDSVFSIFPTGWSYWWSHCSIIVLWGVSPNIWCSLQWCTGCTHIYTLSTRYLFTIYLLSTHYLHTNYSLSTQCLHSLNIWSSQRWCTGCTNIYTLSIHYLHTIYTLTIHYLHNIYTVSISGAVCGGVLGLGSGCTHIYTLSIYYLHTIYTPSTHYLFTIYTLSIHYLHNIYTVSISGAVSGGVLGAHAVTRLLGEPIARGQPGNTPSSHSSAAASIQQPTPGRLSGSSSCSSWCRSRGKRTWNILVF